MVAMVVAAGPAAAHATLLFTSPAGNSAVPTSPTAVTLIFDSPVTLPAGAVRLESADGTSVPLEAAVRSSAGTAVKARVNRVLPVGLYTVTWQVVADDGDEVTGSFRFAVGPSAATLTGSQAPRGSGSTVLWGVAVARWVSFLALAWLAGGVVVPWLSRGGRDESLTLPPVRSWSLVAALSGLVASLVLLAAIPGRSGEPGGLTHLLTSGIGSRPAALALAEAAAYGVTTGLVLIGRTLWVPLCLLGVVVAEALRAHPDAYAPRWGFLLTAVHLVAAAVWVGTLAQVLRLTWRWHQRPGAVKALFIGYARLAAWLFAAVVVTGTLSALVLVPLPALTSTNYGRTLLIKIALVSGVSGLAVAGRLMLGRSRLPVGTTRVEATLLAGVLAMSAVLTASPPPRSVTLDLPFAPPPSGPVVPLGARVGQLGLSVQASAGQLVVQVTAPGAADMPAGGGPVTVEPTPGSSPRYQIAAVLADPSGRESRLIPRSCGAGCFVAPADWVIGTSHLTVRAQASGWTGGQAAFAVVWPPNPAAPALTRMVDLLRATKSLVLYERVTSDTRTGLGTMKRLVVSGPAFLGSEPYGAAQAPITDSIANPDGTTTLLLGYPAESLQADLTLENTTGRILREALTTPNQLVTRTFDYHPE